ncbi:MAG: PD40 domain-containing protein [Verrucomicrobia subdivision 3 bacterium]|nr:PD40 domain-containing protein [Limisphaerales bacterium]
MKTYAATAESIISAMGLFLILLTAKVEAFELVTASGTSANPPIGGNGGSSLPQITGDGRFVLFMSSAGNFVAGPTTTPLPSLFPHRMNVFLRDRSNNLTTLVSFNAAGTAGGNGDSIPAGVSTNGRYALFESSASDLIASDTNNASDVFVRDLISGTNNLVSATLSGLPGNGASRSAVITPDGRYVAFVSTATNLVIDDTNAIADVFVRDLLTGTTTLASPGAKSIFAGAGGCEAPEITPDGQFVVFFATATNLVSGVPAGGDIYVRNLAAGTTIWVSTGARAALQAVQNKTNALSFGHVLSPDGKFVAFETSLTQVTTYPTNGIVLRYNLDTGLTDIVNTNAAVPIGAAEDFRPLAMTPDGRFIAFPANTNGNSGATTCLLVWDGSSGVTTLASVDLNGTVTTNSVCAWPAITPDGHAVDFLSTATDLTTNSLVGEYHLYVRDLVAGSTTLVDAGTNGIGSGVTVSTMPRLSEDGRYVVFETFDGALLPNDSNASMDVFVRDLAGETVAVISSRHPTLVSATPDGSSTLSLLAVSSTGRYIAFASDAPNLVSGDTNGVRDVFVRDLWTGTNLLVSTDSSGVAPSDGFSFEPSISADGRYVAFTSSAGSLTPGDTNNLHDVFVRDLLTDTTTLVSVNVNGMSGNRESYSPSLSADGQGVLFHSRATDLAVGSSASFLDNLYWRDLVANVTYPVTAYTSVAPGGTLPAAMTSDGRYIALGSPTTSWYVWDTQLHARVYTNTAAAPLSGVTISQDGNRIAGSAAGNLFVVDRSVSSSNLISSSADQPGLSGDGRFITFRTTSALDPGDTNGVFDIYVCDLQSGSNTLVSGLLAGAANGASDSPTISADGRFVAYRSSASNLVPVDTNGVPDLFVSDRTTGATLLLSVSTANTPANDRSLTPVFSADGQTIAFQSLASDFIAADFNRHSDVLAYRLVSTSSVPVFRATIVPGINPDPSCRLTWPVVPGKSYRVQFKNNVEDPTWQDFTGGIVIVGNQGWLDDSTSGAATRYYRVVAE